MDFTSKRYSDIILFYLYANMFWGMCVCKHAGGCKQPCLGQHPENIEIVNFHSGQNVSVEILFILHSISRISIYQHLKQTPKPKWDQPGYSHLVFFLLVTAQPKKKQVYSIVQQDFSSPPGKLRYIVQQIFSLQPWETKRNMHTYRTLYFTRSFNFKRACFPENTSLLDLISICLASVAQKHCLLTSSPCMSLPDERVSIAFADGKKTFFFW